MPDLREQLRVCLQGRVCLVGVGNAERGDDGFGVRLAEGLKSERRTLARDEATRDSVLRIPHSAFAVVLARTTPERHLTHLIDGGFDHVLLLDAVDCGAAPGSVVLLDADAIRARFPQISTHRLSLGLLAQGIEAGARTKVRLLGVQPGSVQPGLTLSPAVEATIDLLRDLLLDLLKDAKRPRTEACALPC
jgi:hydrogenase maturation protease